MVKIEISHQDLCRLCGKKFTAEQLDEVLLYAKSELEEVDGDILKIDVKDSNRPDLWSTEGIAREIAGRFGEKGIPNFKLKKGIQIVKNVSTSPVQPMAVCAIARNLKLDDTILSQIIQLQEKLAVSFGRNRKALSMGIYDMDKIKFPVRYVSTDRKKIRFAPLGFEEEMGADEILRFHPKGKEFGHLMSGTSEFPVWMDADNKILSMPPIINSNDVGNVSTKTKNVFIEVTGYDMKFLVTAIDIIAAQLIDRGGTVETVATLSKGKKIVTPQLGIKSFKVDPVYANAISGLGLTTKEITILLEKARYNCKPSGKSIRVEYPSYRQDIMHARDIIEDVMISYGYNNIYAEMRPLPTKGKMLEFGNFIRRVEEACIGMGLQQILSYTLTSRENMFEKMGLQNAEAVEIENAVSQNWSVFRTWLVPQLLEFFSQNMHIEFPQAVFEIGLVTHIDAEKETKTRDDLLLAVGYSASSANYEKISSFLDAIFRNLGIQYTLKKAEHTSFLPGRCANILVKDKMVGFLGEIHPLVVNKWNLEKPVLALEINLSKLQ